MIKMNIEGNISGSSSIFINILFEIRTVGRSSVHIFKKPSVSRYVFDFFFITRFVQNLEDTWTASSIGLVVHMVKRESPVLHIGRPNKSNKSCSSGFFTSQSISQSLLKAGLRLTCLNVDSLLLQAIFIISKYLIYAFVNL